jgi:hypothetical protein
MRVVTIRAIMAFAAAGAAVGGCGSDGGAPVYVHGRPPAPVQLSAIAAHGRVVLEPARVGAGPVDVTIVNLSGRAQRFTLAGSGTRHDSRLAAPGEPVEVVADLRPGRHTLDAPGLRPAVLEVGPPRPSARDDVQQP